jgi:hypothetical protein
VYRNIGGNFIDLGAGLLGTYFGTAAWGDVDNDGDLDIVVTGFDGTNGTAGSTAASGGANPTFTNAGRLFPAWSTAR